MINPSHIELLGILLTLMGASAAAGAALHAGASHLPKVQQLLLGVGLGLPIAHGIIMLCAFAGTHIAA
ncbi:hypothetical protein [Salipiger sp.]|uniref:hypothetical protein n=1 Tax=Salipiger sp. TaxID=2078585 RepID=UPI003A97E79F